jgi:hypothetical protein
MPRTHWLDSSTQTPLIDDYARELGPFLDAMADGEVEEKELESFESRLVARLKEVEPMLNDEQHEKVTHLLCEVAAYTILQVLCDLRITKLSRKLEL